MTDYLTAGKLFTFTAGEYSSYMMHDTFIALETVPLEIARGVANAINQKADAEEEKSGWYDGDRQSEFIAELIRKGWLLQVDNAERHIGSYGSLHLEDDQ